MGIAAAVSIGPDHDGRPLLNGYVHIVAGSVSLVPHAETDTVGRNVVGVGAKVPVQRMGESKAFAAAHLQGPALGVSFRIGLKSVRTGTYR